MEAYLDELPWVTTREACRRLGVSDHTYRRMVIRGDFPPPIRVPRGSQRQRVLVKDIEEYMQKLLDPSNRPPMGRC